MKYTEMYIDLFKMYESGYSIAHCVSADFKMGAGIAKEIENRYHIRNYLRVAGDRMEYIWDEISVSNRGCCIYYTTGDDQYIFNLVTKRNYYNKPTYTSMTNSLLDLKKWIIKFNVKNLAIPLIGCGLDRLDWNKVSTLIKGIFKDVDINIVVCKLK